MQSEPFKYYYSKFRLFLFRSPLLKESIFLSFPVGTKMFQFPTFPPRTLLYSCTGNQTLFSSWVSPFRYPRIAEYLLLPVAFRSLSRLSSALGAKSSTLCSQQLNLLLRINFFILANQSLRLMFTNFFASFRFNCYILSYASFTFIFSHLSIYFSMYYKIFYI